MISGQTIDPETFRTAVKNLQLRLRQTKGKTVSLEEVRTLSKSIANLWFHDIAPLAKLASNNEAALKSIDTLMEQLVSYTLRPTKKNIYLGTVRDTISMYDKQIFVRLHKQVGTVLAGAASIGDNQIVNALSKISESLLAGYQQVHKDLADENRISWRGPADEIREILRELLESLSPDESVIKAKWYKQEPNTEGPTQAQRARYALEQRVAQSHRVSATQETINLVEQSVSRLVRKTFQRANNAAHTPQDRDEVKRILGYFDLLAKDLLGLS
ncbi:MAG: hypothetical protein AB1728_14855 [Bacteroidota bacterium]